MMEEKLKSHGRLSMVEKVSSKRWTRSALEDQYWAKKVVRWRRCTRGWGTKERSRALKDGRGLGVATQPVLLFFL